MQDLEFLKFYTETPKSTHAPGLKVMDGLMARLGNPQERLPCVHVAGTNGKGSCAAMTAAVLRAAGYKTGLFISPDLTGMQERISVNGVYITLSDLAAVTERVRAACAGLEEPSFFEKITAAAFLYFAENGCDRVVLETGLGGRFDATNVIKAPLCSVIMPVGFDHTAVLGSTLSAIAGEKAGIIKPGCPVAVSAQDAEAMDVIRRTCAARGSVLHEVDITKLTVRSRSFAGQVFSYGRMKDIRLSLLGDHQAANACAVIETAGALGLGESAIRAGLQAARWPCRFEYFAQDPPVILDGAHNAHGAAALAAGLRDYFPGARFTMLMGVLADKDYADIVKIMETPAARFVCVAPEDPRALPAEALAANIKTVPALCAGTVPEALSVARAYKEPVCAFGSLYFIGWLRRLIAKETI